MKFTIKQSVLLDAFFKMGKVSSTDIRSDFKLSNRIAICAEKDKVLFFSSNGNLDASYEVTDECKIEEEGTVGIDATIGLNVVKTLGSSDNQICLHDTKNLLHLKNIDSTSKREAKLQTLVEYHDVSISKPRKGFSYDFVANSFIDAVNTVAKYKTPNIFPPKFHMIVLHFLPEAMRFICGCGSRFAVWEMKNAETLKVDENGLRFFFPANQASLVALMAKGFNDLSLIYKDEKNCYIETGNIKMHLKGIPDFDYINYEVHAFRFADSQVIVDVPTREMSSISALMAAVRDKETEMEGSYHSCSFFAKKDEELQVAVQEGKYQADSSCSCDVYPIAVDEFDSSYYHPFLDDLTKFDTDRIRFYCINKNGIMIAEPLNLETDEKKVYEDETVPNAHCPGRKLQEKDHRLIFFFTSVGEEE